MSDKMTDVEKLIERLLDSKWQKAYLGTEAPSVMEEAAAMLRSLADDKAELIETHNSMFDRVKELAAEKASYVQLRKLDAETIASLRAKLERATRGLMQICDGDANTTDMRVTAHATLEAIND